MALSNQISEKLRTARTIEDVVNLLSILFTNLNNQSEQYYDMFWNPVPMDLDLEKYDENGKLIVVQHPNVAKMRITAYSGPSDPNGVQEASVGALYINTSNRDIFYKAVGDDAFGWQKIWTTSNLVAGTNYLTPTGVGSGLRDLDADKITRGTLPVQYGGTGNNSISGILKGNGVDPFSQAIVDVDYLAPSSFTGLIMYSPVAGSVTTGEIRSGWLVCDGASYAKSTYARLYQILGDKYKLSEDSEDTFRVPNLIGRYIKGGVESVGQTGEARVGAHGHTATSTAAGVHRHGISPKATGGVAGTGGGYGTTRIFGTFKTINDDEPFTNADGQAEQYGALGMWSSYKAPNGTTRSYGSSKGGTSTGGGAGFLGLVFDSNRANSWTGAMTTEGNHAHSITVATGGSGTNDVDHIIMVPIIKY